MESSPKIYVLQGFNAKEAKKIEKSNRKWLRQENAVMSRHNYSIVVTKSQGNMQKFITTSKTVSQQRQSRVFKRTIERMSRYSNALLRHIMRRAHKETVELCHDIEIIVAIKPKTKNKNIVATYDHFVLIKNKVNGRKMLSRHSNLCCDRRRKELLNVQWNNVATQKLFGAT